ncbi:hypothetical protein RFI_26227 [Reticulomyxa filosa]|uniref:Uncharacterized protein n=1 Tax=Reticulomyxa filosa TaxID=46433 RepID=X6MDM7_RETFI|nr:hypothetical protein RFI_26227 [Reticulomyxa filosa]|eukprot:ETO11150.1 hypothetical protein RFI_26227 [Reticulomyxa filosa]
MWTNKSEEWNILDQDVKHTQNKYESSRIKKKCKNRQHRHYMNKKGPICCHLKSYRKRKRGEVQRKRDSIKQTVKYNGKFQPSQSHIPRKACNSVIRQKGEFVKQSAHQKTKIFLKNKDKPEQRQAWLHDPNALALPYLSSECILKHEEEKKITVETSDKKGNKGDWKNFEKVNITVTFQLQGKFGGLKFIDQMFVEFKNDKSLEFIYL